MADAHDTPRGPPRPMPRRRTSVILTLKDEEALREYERHLDEIREKHHPNTDWNDPNFVDEP